MAISAAGVGSNLDVNNIVSQLMNLERQPLLKLDTREASYQTQLTAFGNLKGALSGFQSAVQALASPGRFQSYRATSSDTSVLTATAASGAAASTYSIEVSDLAQAQSLVSGGQSSTSAAIGTGTLTFTFGTISGGSFDDNTGRYTGASFTASGASTRTVTIESGNASLAGIRDAINAADIGVTAAIVNDGGASPYRLTLTAKSTGAENSLRIAVSGDAALQSLLAYNPADDAGQNLSQTVAAQNAQFKINGLAVSKGSNSVTDVIEGVTLDLKKTNEGTPVRLTVARDTAGVRSAVDGFVKAYNDLNSAVRNLSGVDAATGAAGVLAGDAAVRAIQSRIRAVLGQSVTGIAGSYNALAQVGVSFQRDGTLAVDSSKLDAALESDLDNIAGLFAKAGKTSDSLVSYVGDGSSTKAGVYRVNVTQIATQGVAQGSATVGAGYTVTEGVNDTLAVSVDGVSATVTLTAGTYSTVAALAAEIQARINGASAIADAGKAVTVSESGGQLRIASASYGSESAVGVSGGTALADLFGTVTATAGVDVAGTINGQSATGDGQLLTGAAGDTLGLELRIAGGALGDRGTVSYAQGYAWQLDKLVESFLGKDGAISSRTEGINRSIKSIGQQREVLERRLEDVEKRYRAQFTALDQLVSSLQSTSNFLAQQLASLPTAG